MFDRSLSVKSMQSLASDVIYADATHARHVHDVTHLDKMGTVLATALLRLSNVDKKTKTNLDHNST